MASSEESASRSGESMQIVEFLGGPADGEVALVPRQQVEIAIEQPGQPDQGTITGRYVATETFSPRGYPAWSWTPDESVEVNR